MDQYSYEEILFNKSQVLRCDASWIYDFMVKVISPHIENMNTSHIC